MTASTAAGPVCVLPAGADREKWLAARSRGLGASEIAAVLGLSPCQSPFGLYWAKIQGWRVEPTEEMLNGLRLEPAIADWWAETQDPNENLRIVHAGLYAHPERRWQLATPDRLIYLDLDCDLGDPWARPLAVLECKWVAQSWDGWGEPGTDDIPVHYRAQVLWQCDEMGVDSWHLAALGPGGFRAYKGRRDEDDLRVMREAGRCFWTRIEQGEPPELDAHPATLRALKALHPSLADRDQEVSPATTDGYRRARALKARAEATADLWEARLRAEMGDARRAVCGGRFVASRSIFKVAETVRHAYEVDRLNPAKSK
jgi:putative phage-type endonuclease